MRSWTTVTAFIEGRTDDTLIADLLWVLLLDWQTIGHQQRIDRNARYC